MYYNSVTVLLLSVHNFRFSMIGKNNSVETEKSLISLLSPHFVDVSELCEHFTENLCDVAFFS